MLPDAMVTMLKSLKLFGMAQAVEELAAQNSPAYLIGPAKPSDTFSGKDYGHFSTQ